MSHIKEFFKMESASGIVLILATILAIIMANTGLAPAYAAFLHLKTPDAIGPFMLPGTLHHWVNDGLMAVFFFMVGLEIKRELVIGSLSSRSQAILPLLAAIGGMAVPALIYTAINYPNHLSGWAIPSATDIAFGLGILSLLGSRVPASLKMLLLAIAVLDDLGAVVIIALFYTTSLSYHALMLSFVCLTALIILNRINKFPIFLYVLIGIFMWFTVLESGVHATLAGVATAFLIPINAKDKKHEHMLHALHPWVAFGIMPLFAFANAGVSFQGMSPSSLADPLTLGIIAGLFIGKQVGIFGTCWLAIKTGVARLPEAITWLHLYGLAVLCGIGFTMSLFIGSLAFTDNSMDNAVRLGVLMGSLLSSVVGFGVLRHAFKNRGK